MTNLSSADATLGCRLNAYETVAMRELSREAGIDAAVVNTCAVTAEAVRKSRQAVRRLRRENPDATLVATGCAAQIDPAAFDTMKEVDVVLGNSRKLDPGAWAEISAGQPPIVADVMQARNANRLIAGFGSRSRAHIQVQNGCDHRCTFCVIPFGRGNSRSVPSGEVVAQVRKLTARGYKEIVLSGVDITAWGEDLSGGRRLGSLAKAILRQVPELPRLRVSSVDPVELDSEFLEVLATETRLAPHLHLSVQSGDDMILKRMKRRHLRDDMIRLCQRVRSQRPDIAFGADLIAGFPTETDAMFENTLRAVKDCGLTWLHVFPYSRRAGTPAARMPQVDRSVIRKRAARLRALGAQRVLSFLESCVGGCGDVLMESPRMGRTGQFAQVEFDQDQPEGALLRVRFVGIDSGRLKGTRNPGAGRRA